jgi:3-oxoacyl-[acyl-carrier-protein] synthase II
VSGCAIVAWGASSGLGEGEAAFATGDRAVTRVVRDEELAAAGLGRPYCARVPAAFPPDRDRATVLFERALTACATQLDSALPGWRDRRVGLAIGTSSGGMRTFESAKDLETKPLPIEATYLGPVLAAVRPCAFEPFTLVLGACASSTIAAGIARAWLLDDACDVALAGGFDALGVFVASGFEVLRATSAVAGPRPFRLGRDGLALGEGAAVLAFARPHDVVPSAVHAYVTGFGATCDATHLTAPDRTGAGLARAMNDALRVAGIDAREC